MQESDLYPALKGFLEAQGHDVKGEVQGCDVLAVRGDEAPVVVELKRSLNLGVVLQAVDRLALTPKVYVGVPHDASALRQQRKRVLKLLRMLGLGLLRIDAERARVEVLLDPGAYRPRPSRHRKERLLGEFERRVGDPNAGGTSTKNGLVTAYRQRALAIGELLLEQGPTKAAEVARALDEPKARQVLYDDVYGWFERVSTGIYAVSPRGERELPLWRERSGA